MFDKFGEFGSAEELCKAAEGLKAEGDRESLLLLAKENGIDPEDAEDYMDGLAEELASDLMAARGRLAIEKAESKLPDGVRDVLFTQAEAMAQESAAFRALVMKKGRRLEKVVEAMREEARKAAKGGVGCVCGTDRQLAQRILGYYEGDKA